MDINDSISILKSAVVAFITAVITVRLSLHKYASRMWWERREEAYSKIIGNLSYLLISLRRQEEHYLDVDRLNESEREEIYEEIKTSREEIEVLAREGSFRITDEATNKLWDLWETLGEGADHPIEGISKKWKAVRRCRDEIDRKSVV